ncbi:MAG TPA: hypothetical protein VNZ58_00030, partial [Thermomicrobiales bacterium]|nr:hypothetical protein [Thermomicrobiales bacterium]
VLTNPAQSIKVYMQRVLFEGQTWEAAAEWVFASYRDDQGANPTTYGPVVTDSRFWYATDGEYGLRLGEGTPSDDPESFVLVFAADFDDDEVDTTALLQEANAAIRLNDNPPFTALDEFIEVSAG